MWHYRTAGNHRRAPIIILSLLSVLASSLAAQTITTTPTQDKTTTLCSLEGSFVAIAQKVRPGVVSITAKYRADLDEAQTTAQLTYPSDHLGRRVLAGLTAGAPGNSDSTQSFPPSVTSTGSGIIARRDGPDFYVLTNEHVIGDAPWVMVTLQDETELKGRVIGVDSVTDLAVVRVSSPGLSDVNVVQMGDSDKIKVGDWAIALGSPLGFQETMTVGVVSALQRKLEDGATLYTNLIQTDAAINRGNSGGPLLDIQGRVIGINSAIASSTGGFVGLSFAIPINTARSILDTLIKNGRVIRGWLGIGIQDLSPPLQEYYGATKGVLIAFVSDIGPGKTAGLLEEDVITAINGAAVSDIFQVQLLIANALPGDRLKLDVLRKRLSRQVTLVVAQSPRTSPPRVADSGSSKPRATLGIRVRTVTDEIAQRLGIKRIGGAIIIDLESGGIAEEAGLDVGDIITRINVGSVASEEDFSKMATDVPPGGVIVLRVIRDGAPKIIGFKRE